MGLAALQGGQVDTGSLTGQAQPRPGAVRNVNVSGQHLAIFKANHSSSPSLMIAATFLRNTSLNRLQRELKVRGTALQLLDDPFTVPLFVLVGTRILVAHAEAHGR